MLGLGKLLVGTTALVTWCGFLVIDKRKHPLHAGNLLNSAAVLTLVWLAWGGLDMGLWVVGGVYGVPGCFDA